MKLYPENDGIEFTTRERFAEFRERISELQADRDKWRIEAQEAIEEVKQVRAVISAQAHNLVELRRAIHLARLAASRPGGLKLVVLELDAALEGIEPE